MPQGVSGTLVKKEMQKETIQAKTSCNCQMGDTGWLSIFSGVIVDMYLGQSEHTFCTIAVLWNLLKCAF